LLFCIHWKDRSSFSSSPSVSHLPPLLDVPFALSCQDISLRCRLSRKGPASYVRTCAYDGHARFSQTGRQSREVAVGGHQDETIHIPRVEDVHGIYYHRAVSEIYADSCFKNEVGTLRKLRLGMDIPLRGAKRRVIVPPDGGTASAASKMFSRLVTGVFRAAKHDCDLSQFFNLNTTSSIISICILPTNILIISSIPFNKGADILHSLVVPTVRRSSSGPYGHTGPLPSIPIMEGILFRSYDIRCVSVLRNIPGKTTAGTKVPAVFVFFLFLIFLVKDLFKNFSLCRSSIFCFLF